MKIRCTKYEFANLVATCMDCRCTNCALRNFCKWDCETEARPFDRLAELVEIERETTVGDLLNKSPCVPREFTSTWPTDITCVTLKG